MADPKKAADTVVMMEVTVARGRCLHDKDGVIAKAGDVIQLPRDEALRCIASGHLVDPLAPEIKRAEGPEFRSSGGPSVNSA